MINFKFEKKIKDLYLINNEARTLFTSIPKITQVNEQLKFIFF